MNRPKKKSKSRIQMKQQKLINKKSPNKKNHNMETTLKMKVREKGRVKVKENMKTKTKMQKIKKILK